MEATFDCPPTISTVTLTEKSVTQERKRGRPPGSKNKLLLTLTPQRRSGRVPSVSKKKLQFEEIKVVIQKRRRSRPSTGSNSKRGRGRPKKSYAEEMKSSVKRGRPFGSKKNLQTKELKVAENGRSGIPTVNGTNQRVPQKQGRGRPLSGSGSKRGRGRPFGSKKKSPVTPEQQRLAKSSAEDDPSGNPTVNGTNQRVPQKQGRGRPIGSKKTPSAEKMKVAIVRLSGISTVTDKLDACNQESLSLKENPSANSTSNVTDQSVPQKQGQDKSLSSMMEKLEAVIMEVTKDDISGVSAINGTDQNFIQKGKRGRPSKKKSDTEKREAAVDNPSGSSTVTPKRKRGRPLGSKKKSPVTPEQQRSATTKDLNKRSPFEEMEVAEDDPSGIPAVNGTDQNVTPKEAFVLVDNETKDDICRPILIDLTA